MYADMHTTDNFIPLGRRNEEESLLNNGRRALSPERCYIIIFSETYVLLIMKSLPDTGFIFDTR